MNNIRLYNITLVNTSTLEEVDALWLQGYELTALADTYNKGWSIKHFDSMVVTNELHDKYLRHINDERDEYEDMLEAEWVKDCCSSDYPFYDSEEYPGGDDFTYHWSDDPRFQEANPNYEAICSNAHYFEESDDVPF